MTGGLYLGGLTTAVLLALAALCEVPRDRARLVAAGVVLGLACWGVA